MSQRTRRPLWPLLTAVLVFLPVLYVLGFGISVWLIFSNLMPEWLLKATLVFYEPMYWIQQGFHSQEWLRDLINQYIEFWAWLARR